jgi:hypothetical protein
MKDAHDTLTLDIISTEFPETVKPKLGRPSKGPQKLSGSAKQRAYKERQAELGIRPRTMWLSDRELEIINKWLKANRSE